MMNYRTRTDKKAIIVFDWKICSIHNKRLYLQEQKSECLWNKPNLGHIDKKRQFIFLLSEIGKFSKKHQEYKLMLTFRRGLFLVDGAKVFADTSKA